MQILFVSVQAAAHMSCLQTRSPAPTWVGRTLVAPHSSGAWLVSQSAGCGLPHPVL
jgi:uncharacterized protein YcnI